MGNELAKNKMKKVEDTNTAHAGLVILARLVARCHLQRLRSSEAVHDAQNSEHRNIEEQGNDQGPIAPPSSPGAAA